MSGKRKTDKKQLSMEFIVGLVFIISLGVLGFFTIILSGDKLTRKNHRREADFAYTNGLGTGDKVLLRGVIIGTVDELYIPEATTDSVRVRMKLEKPLEFHEDYLVAIRSSSVLGGSYIYLELGNYDKPIVTDAVLKGTMPKDVFGEAAKLFSKLNDTAVKLDATMAEIQRFSKALNNSNSTVYRLLHEDKLYADAADAFKTLKISGDKVGKAADEISAISSEFKGKLGKAADSVTAAGTSVKVAADKVTGAADVVQLAVADARSGKGTVGKLLTDDKLYDEFSAAVTNIKRVAGKASDGKSSIGKLLNDDGAMYGSIKTAFDDAGGTFTGLKDIVAKVKSGEGTIGKLVMDETVWRDLKQAIKDIQGAIDDFREQAPILTFGSFIFGSL